MLKRRGFVSCALCAGVGLVAASVTPGAQAQAPGFTRKLLQKTEYPDDRHVALLVEVTIEPNAHIPRHTHPGVESAYIITGSGTLSVKGQPDRVVNPGEGFHIPPETPHSLRNGPDVSRVVATYIVEKDKPLASPAPE